MILMGAVNGSLTIHKVAVHSENGLETGQMDKAQFEIKSSGPLRAALDHNVAWLLTNTRRSWTVVHVSW